MAARLNGYVVGQGGIDQFDAETSKLGLDDAAIKYVRQLVIKYEGQGLHCWVNIFSSVHLLYNCSFGIWKSDKTIEAFYFFNKSTNFIYYEHLWWYCCMFI